MEFFDLDLEVSQERLPAECSLNAPLNLSLSLQLFGRIEPKTENIRRQSRRITKVLRERHNGYRLQDLIIDSTRTQANLIPHLVSSASGDLNTPILEHWEMLSKYYQSLGYSLPSLDKFDFKESAGYWNAACSFRDMLLKSQKVEKKVNKQQTYVIYDITFEFVEGVVFIHGGEDGFNDGFLAGGAIAAMTYTELLALFKILNQRAQALLMCNISKGLEPDMVPSPSTIHSIYAEADHMLRMAGQGAIDLLKLWEPLVLTQLGDVLGDRFGLEDDFKLTIRTEAALLADQLNLKRSFARMTELIKSETRKQPLFQLFGLFKHFAYPRVYSRDTINTILGVSDKPSANDPEEYLHDQCEIRKEFYTRYVKAYHRAPQLDLGGLSPGSYLRRALEAGKMPNEKSPLYTNLEWFFVKFKKSIEWPLSDTLSTFLSDKAITQNRSTWLDNETSSRDNSEKRLLLKFIKENEDSVARVVAQAKEIYDNEDDRIIALKVKEMELKLKGRGFGLMTFKPRLLQVLRESIAKKTSKLFPEITMTASDLDLKKRKFLVSRKSDDRRGYVHMSKSLDINKFCTSQRQFNSQAVFQCLDELLGTGALFSRVHEIFEKTWIVDGSASDPPNLKKFKDRYQKLKDLGIDAPHTWGDGVFSGLMGGIEGLCQYVWTICLLLRVERVLSKTSLTHFVMAQGDNVIINLIIPIEIERDGSISPSEHRRVKSLSTSIDTQLAMELEKSGLTLKIEETLSSEHISIYGKDLHCPHHLTLSLKKAGSASIISSEQYQDVPTFLAGLSTSIETISECVNDKVSAHLFGVILAHAGWKSLCVSQTWKGWEYPYQKDETINRVRSQGIKLTEGEQVTVEKRLERNPDKRCLEWILATSFLGSALGMLPFPTPVDLEKRGVGDYITHRLALTKKALSSRVLPRRIEKLIRSMVNLPHSRETDLAKLFDSPFSLNLATEEDATSVIKRLARSTLRDLDIKNERLRAHIDIMDRGLQDLDRELGDSETINPRVAHLIRDITDEKESEMFVTKFATARTMRTVALENPQDVSVVSLLNKKSRAKETYTIWRSKRAPAEDWECSTQRAKIERDSSWGKNVIGVTSPSPVEAMSYRLVDPSTWEEEKKDQDFTINYYLSKPSLISHQARLERGPLVPYYGTQTQPLIAKAYNELKGNPKTNKALMLLSLRETIVKSGSNLDKLIMRLCERALDLDLNTLPSLRAQEEASSGEGIRGGIKESMSPVGPDNFYTNITHKVFNRRWLSGFHINIADFIIWGLTCTRKSITTQGTLSGNLPICIPACRGCLRRKEREFLDIDNPPRWECKEGVKDKAYMYFTTWCDLPRLSTLPSLDPQDAVFMIGRQLACSKGQDSGAATKFYNVSPESLGLLHPRMLLLGYSEGLIFSYLRSQHIVLGCLYHPTITELLPSLEKYTLETIDQHARQLGYLFQEEETAKELLNAGLCPYTPRAIPLTITELKNAVCITVSRSISVTLETKKSIHLMPESGISEEEVVAGRHAARTLGGLLNIKVPNLVYIDCDLTKGLLPWEPELPSEVLQSENFKIDGKRVTLYAKSQKRDNSIWEERGWTCSNSREILAKGVKTKSLFIHQSVPSHLDIDPALIVVIGGGLGGCVVPYLQHWRRPPVIFTTLFSERERISEDGDLIIPPELLVRGLSGRMVERELLEAELCDVTVPGNRKAIVDAVKRRIKPNESVLLIDEIENRGDAEDVLQQSISTLLQSLEKHCSLTSVHTIRESNVKHFTQRLNILRRGRYEANLFWNRYNRRDQYEALIVIPSESRMTECTFSVASVQAAFQKIDDGIEVEAKLEAHSWGLPELPPREKKILLGYVSSVFLKLGLVVIERHMSSTKLIDLLESAGPQMISWEEKQTHRSWASTDSIKEKGVTQDRIMALLCFAWTLKGLKHGVWDTNMDAVVEKTVYITHGPRLCALDEKPRVQYAEFKLQSKKRVEDLKGYLGALLHLETFFPLGDR
ncbi:polymerase protein [Snakehead rhabdovirus]|uniref:RNA-directed RNA polymerase L n=1 Tax=Snakehead rhabdovirus TaxID=103603 RepID=L_SHRV|nr:polymerase protein [Snakehead virus]Q9QJT4.1 RecName: Full=RNA-directed RNA polymerase L; Short=Protein L; AltName: Full=Large structural protein; AltName: Full=Replicase; AltName: Full=Transcriptase; Includes: RecName: Full=RNA-directed RNA polymerase; Includes: RecName: Full=GTP phosphohydrolase; Includes: RecName: Full=GDP polyribonucleotidyltransferase; AltName: Full=PRNTase; Includes: RecName: Full=mRNA cap methyltransferase; AltName: Full=mRNA (guanine-N(7)-)-methyltransferase; Short=G-N7